MCLSPQICITILYASINLQDKNSKSLQICIERKKHIVTTKTPLLPEICIKLPLPP